MREITEQDLHDLAEVVSGATAGPWYIHDGGIYTHTAVGGKPVMEERQNVHYAAVFDPDVTEGLLDLVNKRGESIQGLVSTVVRLENSLTEAEAELAAVRAELASVRDKGSA